MPTYQTESEVFAFITLRSLYRDYLCHRITKTQAQIERRGIKKMYMDYHNYENNLRKQQKEICRMRVEMAKVGKEIETNGCPLCRRMAQLLDGRISLREVNDNK